MIESVVRKPFPLITVAPAFRVGTPGTDESPTLSENPVPYTLQMVEYTVGVARNTSYRLGSSTRYINPFVDEI